MSRRPPRTFAPPPPPTLPSPRVLSGGARHPRLVPRPTPPPRTRADEEGEIARTTESEAGRPAATAAAWGRGVSECLGSTGGEPKETTEADGLHCCPAVGLRAVSRTGLFRPGRQQRSPLNQVWSGAPATSPDLSRPAQRRLRAPDAQGGQGSRGRWRFLGSLPRPAVGLGRATQP